MPYCIAYGCTSQSYPKAGFSNTTDRRRFFGFPKDIHIQKCWLASLKLESLKVTGHTKVCDLHFLPTDFQCGGYRLKCSAVPLGPHVTEKVASMDHNYCIPSKKDPSEQADIELDIISNMEQDNVLLKLPKNIEEARKQGMTSSMIEDVLQNTKMCGFSEKIESNCKNCVSSKQIDKRVKSMDSAANVKQCSYSPQNYEGFKMEADSLGEEFVSDEHFEKPYSIEQPDAFDQEYIFSPQTVRNRISIKTEPYNQNFVSPSQQFDELAKMAEIKATSVEFVNLPQFVDSANAQNENAGETLVNWPQPLQAITKVNHDPQVSTVKIDLGLSAVADLGSQPPYTCSSCGKGFKTQTVMTLHIAKFHNTKPTFKCNVCGKAFVKSSSLNKHNFTHIEKCGVCGQKFNRLSLHMLTHTGERPHRCWVCQKVFIANSNTGLSNIISSNKNGFYDCDICGKEISARNNFTLHMKRHTLKQTHLTCVCSKTHGSSNDTEIVVTSTQEGSLNCIKTCVDLKHNEERGKADVNNDQNTCSFCDHRFQTQFELHLHLFTHFKGRVQDCNVCVYGFTCQELLLKHLIDHVESSMYDSCAYVIGVQKKKQSVILRKEKWGTAVNYSSTQGFHKDTANDAHYEQPHECDVREKGINTKSNISEQMATHTGEQPGKSGVCGNLFIQKDHIRADMLSDSAQGTHKYPHKCTICGKGFTQKGNLKRHMLTHTGEQPHKCGVCGKGFRQKVNVMRHILTHTREFPHKGVSPHHCGVCSKEFTQKSILSKHMLTHTGKGHYKCCVCEQRFNQKAGIIQHMLTHTGDWSHKCGVCRKGCVTKNSLNKHLSTHTDKYLPEQYVPLKTYVESYQRFVLQINGK